MKRILVASAATLIFSVVFAAFCRLLYWLVCHHWNVLFAGWVLMVVVIIWFRFYQYFERMEKGENQ